MLVSQRWVQSETTVPTVMEKNKDRGGERGLKIWNFQEYWRNSKLIFLGLIKNNVNFSGRDHEKVMCNFQGSWF